MNDEALPPLPELEIKPITSKVLDQAVVDRAVRIVYERRPDLFVKSVERIKRWEKDKTQNTDAWIWDEFSKEMHSYLENVVAKEINLPNLSARTAIYREMERRALLMFGMRTRSQV